MTPGEESKAAKALGISRAQFRKLKAKPKPKPKPETETPDPA